MTKSHLKKLEGKLQTISLSIRILMIKSTQRAALLIYAKRLRFPLIFSLGIYCIMLFLRTNKDGLISLILLFATFSKLRN